MTSKPTPATIDTEGETRKREFQGLIVFIGEHCAVINATLDEYVYFFVQRGHRRRQWLLKSFGNEVMDVVK